MYANRCVVFCVPLVVLLVATTARGLAQSTPPATMPPSLQAPKAMQPAASDDELRKLLIARYNSVAAEIDSQKRESGARWTGVNADQARRVLVSWIEINPADEVALREQFVDLMKAEEAAYEKFVKDGVTPLWTLEQKRYARLDAEIELLRAKRKSPADPKGPKK